MFKDELAFEQSCWEKNNLFPHPELSVYLTLLWQLFSSLLMKTTFRMDSAMWIVSHANPPHPPRFLPPKCSLWKLSSKRDGKVSNTEDEVNGRTVGWSFTQKVTVLKHQVLVWKQWAHLFLLFKMIDRHQSTSPFWRTSWVSSKRVKFIFPSLKFKALHSLDRLTICYC